MNTESRIFVRLFRGIVTIQDVGEIIEDNYAVIEDNASSTMSLLCLNYAIVTY
jgi:hypothetical protein